MVITGRSRKPFDSSESRGFESHSLRHFFAMQKNGEISPNNFAMQNHLEDPPQNSAQQKNGEISPHQFALQIDVAGPPLAR